ncbi:MAG: chloride channel protein [Polyangiaceae bacterium]
MRGLPGIPTLDDIGAFARLFEFRAVSRWVGLGLIAGVLTGLAAAAIFLGMDLLRQLFLVNLAGFSLIEPSGEQSWFASHEVHTWRPWLLPLVPACGGAAACWVLGRMGPAHHHGTDALVHTFHHSSEGSRLRRSLLGALGAVLVIGSGGSGGREGPTAVAGGAIGSWLGRLLKLSPRERRLLLLAGAAGGISAIFRTPLGAALFVVEVLYRDDFEVDGLVPAVLSSVVAYSVFTMIFGADHLFRTAGHYDFDPRQLPLYLVMAFGAALVGVVFIRVFHGFRERVAGALHWPAPLKAFVGCGIVGLIALWVPQAFEVGYGWIQELLVPTGRFTPIGLTGAAMLFGYGALKIVTTTLTVGSGASAGVFGPSVVIGGFVGGAFGQAFHAWFPDVVTQPGAFVIVGMACFVGGVAHAPISTLVMASEMTGSYDLLVPIMLAEVVTVSLMQRTTLFPTQVLTRRDSPAHGAEYVLDLLSHVTVRDVYDSKATVEPVPANTPIQRLLRYATDADKAIFPVVAETGETLGLVTMETLRAFFFDEDIGRIAIAADCALPFISVRLDDTLAVALERFASSHYPELPVVREGGDEIVGLLSYEEVLRAYSRELLRRKMGESETAAAE